MPTVTAAPSSLDASKLVKNVLENRQPATSSTTSSEIEKVESAPEVTGEEQISPKFAALARKEKAIRSKAQELKAWEDRLKAKETEYETSYVPKSALKDRVKSDFHGFMAENELTYDEITQAVLNGPNPEGLEIKKLRAELADLRAAQEKTTTQIDDTQKQAYERAVEQIRKEAKLLIDENADFETIKESDQSEAVVELIKEMFEKTGQILSVKEAAKEVEEYLLEEALRMASFKKVKAKLSPQEELAGEKALPTLEKLQPKSAPIQTLTNGMTSSSKPMTAEERKQRAILAFNGQLK